MRQHLLLVCIIITLSWQQSVGQDLDFVVNAQYFTMEEGLSSKYIYSIVKDGRGIVWLGTGNGLNRFDGQHFKVFTTAHGLATNQIKYIHEDGEVLWCVHFSKEVGGGEDFSLFHTLEERVMSLEELYGNNLPFSREDILSVTVKPFLIHLKNGDFYTIKDAKLVSLPKLQEDEFFIAFNEEDCVVFNERGFVRKIDTEGDELFQTKTLSFGEFYPEKELHRNGKSSKGDNWFNYYLNGESGLLKVTADGGISRHPKYLQVLQSLDIPSRSFYDQEFFMPYLPEYDVFAHSYKDIFVLFNEDGEIIHLDKEALEGNGKNILLQDEHHTFWITAEDEGFFQLELKQNKFKNYFFDETWGCRGIMRIGQHFYFNHSRGIYKTQADDFSTFSIIPSHALATTKGRDSTLWVSSYKILWRYDPSSKEKKTYNLPKKFEVWAMYADKENMIWYGQKGLYRLNPETGEIQEANYNGFEELANYTIYHFHEKEDGYVWLCTTAGLYEWHPEKGVLARYWDGGEGRFHIPSHDVRHLYFDEKDSSYWLATGEDGLIHWKPGTGESRGFTFHRSMSNIIHSVYADDYGYLWLSTENGIVQFNKADGYFSVYTEKHGLAFDELNRVSSFQDTDGTIYFGHNKGITAFHPRDFKDNEKDKSPTKVVVIELNQYLDKTRKIENLSPHFHKTQRITLNAGDRFFTLTFALDNYGYNKKALYHHRINGEETEWTVTKTNEISISGLPYGHQLLQVKASLEDGSYSELLEIPIQVKRPFYLTWWFLLSLIIGIVSATFAIIRWRTKRLNQQKAILQAEVKNRTKKIAIQAEELKALDRAKSIFFANVSHELRTPITLIQGPIHSVLERGNLTEKDIQLLKIANRNTHDLLDLVNEILDLTKLENSKLRVENKPLSLQQFLKRIIGNFQSLAEKKGIDLSLTYEVEENSNLVLDADKLAKIMNNLISNALKFTWKNGTIQVTASDTDTEICIKVKDNGKGISAQDLPHVFNRFYQSSTNTKAEGGLGIGLSLSMEFAKLMGGKMWAESSTDTKNHGSTFFLALPKKIGAKKQDKNGTENPKTAHPSWIIDAKQDSEAAWQVASVHADPNNSPSEGAPTILLVEDHLDLQEYISFVLSPHYKVITRENGSEALAYLSNIPENDPSPDLIISDMMMPIMDGLEFLQKFKAHDKWRSIPVIMLTARAELKNRLKALRIGVDDYMVKPFQEQELLLRIENLLRNYEERKNYALSQLAAITKTAGDSPNPSENTLVIASTDDELWLERIEEITLQYITNPQFSMDFIADELDMNRVVFYRNIKKLTGLTANQYIRLIRMRKAKDYLENQTYKTVKDVAQAIGFQRTDYFSQLYKKEYGKMPSDYFK